MPLLFKASDDAGFEITNSHTDLNLEESVPPTFQVVRYYRPTKRFPQRKKPEKSDGKKRVWNGRSIITPNTTSKMQRLTLLVKKVLYA